VPKAVIAVEGLSKYYRLGQIGGTTLREDVDRWWSRIRGNPDPLMQADRLGQPQRRDGDVWALRNVTLSVEEGAVLGIVGSNGAGKSTLLKIMSRITSPTTGRVLLRGRVNSLLEVGTGFHPDLTGRENIYLNGTILGMTAAEVGRKLDDIIEFAEIERFIDTPIKRYSSGMKVRLAFAVAAHLEPDILIVDEVLAVGDAAFQRKCIGKIGEAASAGRTVLFVSHNLGMVRKLCSQGIWLHRGVVMETGDIDTVVDSYVNSNLPLGEEYSGVFPAVNEEHGVAIESMEVGIEESAEGARLTVIVRTSATRATRQIGIGLIVRTVRGVEVSMLAPTLTGFVLDHPAGTITCELIVEQLDRHLSGGDYILGLWLSKLRSEWLVRVDNAAKFSVRARDIYGTGTLFESDRFGVVPIPARFRVLDS